MFIFESEYTDSHNRDIKQAGLLLAYYISRLDREAISNLGYSGFTEAFQKLGKLIGDKPNNIKNMRDEFDPYFPNTRAGWYQREMSPSRKEIFDKYENVPDEQLTKIVLSMVNSYKENGMKTREEILRDLGALIRQSTIHYSQDFIWQDVNLTNEFKGTYEDYLSKSNASIEYYDSTSVITTSTSKYIFVPNQWFVIAAYAVGVFSELGRYKEYFLRVASESGKRPDEYAKHLRDNASVSDKTEFQHYGQKVFSAEEVDAKKVEKAVNRLWRFVTDYSWWSGQKTVDRGDFHNSVVLNMLNLVNASQGYVADIVDAYGSDSKLAQLTRNLGSFTTNLEGVTYDFELVDEYEEEKNTEYFVEETNEGKHKITISVESIKKLNGGK